MMTLMMRIMLKAKNMMLIIVANHQLDDFYSTEVFRIKISEKG
ncbi:hypothetical protein M983_0596 [Proteus myxofaciens ATCC 19692]|uniref:Uncharacterized protein n=1 Tax=Proteus myxofaciens ATCC 19692 TaxID=1354337 RepID=A0A198GFI9_9GAMM|nr:hypothetical protein M983_0596 [Proteus myxofaciens ATCC 19692]